MQVVRKWHADTGGALSWGPGRHVLPHPCPQPALTLFPPSIPPPRAPTMREDHGGGRPWVCKKPQFIHKPQVAEEEGLGGPGAWETPAIHIQEQARTWHTDAGHATSCRWADLEPGEPEAQTGVGWGLRAGDHACLKHGLPGAWSPLSTHSPAGVTQPQPCVLVTRCQAACWYKPRHPSPWHLIHGPHTCLEGALLE